jgi:hypothetical protein
MSTEFSPPFLFEIPPPPCPPLLQWLKDLQKQYETMDAPPHVPASASKLQFVSTFDPVEELPDSRRISELVERWRAVVSIPSPDAADVVRATRDCAARPESFHRRAFR